MGGGEREGAFLRLDPLNRAWGDPRLRTAPPSLPVVLRMERKGVDAGTCVGGGGARKERA